MRKFIQDHELFIKTVLAILAVTVIGSSAIQRLFHF